MGKRKGKVGKWVGGEKAGVREYDGAGEEERMFGGEGGGRAGGERWKDRIKVLVVHTNIQIKRQITKGINDKGMIQVMMNVLGVMKNLLL